MITTTDPRTGVRSDTDLAASTPAEVDTIALAAADALPTLARRGREFRATLLDAMAAAIEADREQLVATADAETGLGPVRLNGELSRSAFQFRLFAEAVREGSFLEAAIDHAGDTPLGAAPDVRRMLVAAGPVAVFGSSNFPFAFSVLGGDVASAIAAGSPVVIKAHGSHPLTSARSFDALRAAGDAVDAPAGTFGIVYGQQAGVALVKHPAIAAAGFTGSLGAANALRAAIDTRPDPIPFYGELSSVNPLVVTAGAVAVRAESIATGLFGAFTGSAGQLCTKPGIAFVPAGAAGQPLVDALVALTRASTPQVLLNDRIRDSFVDISARLAEVGGAPLAAGGAGAGAADGAGAEIADVAEVADVAGFEVAPRLLETTATELTSELSEECFGPLLVIARYDSLSEVGEAFLRVPRSLTATVHAEDDELSGSGGGSGVGPGDGSGGGSGAAGSDGGEIAALLPILESHAGRIVFNGYPTGVRVSWAQQHGGPWPATNSQHTSVGVTAVRRWLRPVAWQNAPQQLLPAELRDGPLEVPTRLDGVLTLPAA
ncbi:hypothetical protein B7R21_02365 [Subtercola boreus]|uniref:Aldehyde dehydrogenase domain-containing protein n=1 Tax=Subtercola boreus TaxID=120213 RepID=A0A3E0W1J6_9MICO|nr:aldehyde dehydrogenase family protein [Subtercola boreus]RFA16244.1 hypothetical protein B7R21_02365 [Subtercola boreus]